MKRKKLTKKKRRWERETKEHFPSWRKDLSLKIENIKDKIEMGGNLVIDTYYSKVQNKKHRISCVCSVTPNSTVAYQAPLSMEFSRLEYWSQMPLPSLGNLPFLGIRSNCISFLSCVGKWIRLPLYHLGSP